MVFILQADLNYGLIGGTATWLGEGTWTSAGQKAICIDFYDPDVSSFICVLHDFFLYTSFQNDKPTCCCELMSQTLGQNESSELQNCDCQV